MVITSADTRVRDRISRFPIDSKLGDSFAPGMASPLGVTDSLSLDGSTEDLRNTTNQSLGPVADWTVMMWVKRISNFASSSVIFEWKEASGNGSRNRWTVDSTVPGRQDITIYDDPSGANNQFLRNDSIWVNGAWMQLLVTHRSTSSRMYKNGSSIVADTTPTVTQIGDDRQINQCGNGINGNLHSVAIWSAELDSSNVTAVYNGGDGTNFDLREDSGNYNQSANLEHWWVFGADDSSDNAMGTDYGNGVNPINIMDNAVNLTIADLTADSPT